MPVRVRSFLLLAFCAESEVVLAGSPETRARGRSRPCCAAGTKYVSSVCHVLGMNTATGALGAARYMGRTPKNGRGSQRPEREKLRPTGCSTGRRDHKRRRQQMGLHRLGKGCLRRVLQMTTSSPSGVSQLSNPHRHPLHQHGATPVMISSTGLR